jgi:SHS2 domain-containing protein
MFRLNHNTFYEIEHTADTGMQVTGSTLEELFANAAFSMISVLYSRVPDRGEMEKKIELQESALQELMVRWLSEINYLLTVHHLLLAEIPDLHLSRNRKAYHLKATIQGMDSTKYEEYVKTEIKAVTYHQLSINKDENGYRCRIIFDI